MLHSTLLRSGPWPAFLHGELKLQPERIFHPARHLLPATSRVAARTRHCPVPAHQPCSGPAARIVTCHGQDSAPSSPRTPAHDDCSVPRDMSCRSLPTLRSRAQIAIVFVPPWYPAGDRAAGRSGCHLDDAFRGPGRITPRVRVRQAPRRSGASTTPPRPLHKPLERGPEARHGTGHQQAPRWTSASTSPSSEGTRRDEQRRWGGFHPKPPRCSPSGDANGVRLP